MQVPDSEDDQECSSDSDEEMGEVARTPAKQAILGRLACSSRDGNASALLEHAVQQLGKYEIISYGPESEGEIKAYIVGKETKRGWGLLQAIACGVPLVSEDWLSSSISEGKWKAMNVFRSDQFGQSPRSVEAGATTVRILEGQRIKILSDKKDAASIRKLVKLCGGRIAETRMDVVINDGAHVLGGCANVEKKWLADSVEAGEVMDFEGYIVEP
ncbi:unnamed protein product [Chondrus crispus]|uniref:BRCT domain-containing protein n=1 Tax=Chondrus crispus TaxID=2769 RepID=R7QDD6_CHOCR|nr:unnamed protein product [Chondrus crispus]CDF35798.1 unnamed protein product [Chondrus crispus]|eukprot:XP_005715617.1 unnamed protein product [Chondrus crispus]